MSNQALYRKWRARTFEGILGQDHIVRTLRNQIRAGKLGHAYLFAGVRGTGKTSTARILAKAANCIGETDDPPCNECSICRSINEGASLDLIEIDAASNRGIDEIRELRERVGFMPLEARFKFYVIDEVHMLTNEAFNALLKTLEEPPEHVVFVLCTTEPHRLPDTILSRCQRFDFRRATQQAVEQKLSYICEQEGLRISQEALAYLARRGAGSFRDAESLLDQVAAYGGGEISLELVQAVLGAVPYRRVLALTAAVVRGDVQSGFRAIAQAFSGGADARQLVSSLVEQLRGVLLMRIGASHETLLVSENERDDLLALAKETDFSLRRVVQGIRSFTEAGNALRTTARAEIALELALVEALMADDDNIEAQGQQPPSPREAADQVNETQQAPSAPEGAARGQTQRHDAAPGPATETPASRTEAVTQPAAEVRALGGPSEARGDSEMEPNPAPSAAKPEVRTFSLEMVQGNWQRIVARMRAQSPQLQAVLRSVYPVGVSAGVVTLACEGPFHRDRLSEDKRREQVEQVVSEVLGATCRIECIVDRPLRAKEQESASEVASQNLFERADSEAERRKELLEHPAVKELTQRGGQVRRVELNPDADSDS